MASQPHGNNHVFLFSKETTKGTPVSPTKDLGLRQNISFNDQQAAREIFTTGQANANEIRGGKGDLTGSMELFVQHGRIFELAMGSVAHAQEGETSDWTHTFTFADDLPSFTLEDSYELLSSDKANTYEGCMINSLTLALALDGQLSARADFSAMDVVNSTSATADVISTLPTFADFEGSFKVGTLDSEVALGQVQNMELTINRNTKKQWGLGSRIPNTIQAGNANVEFSASLAFQNNDERERLLGGTSLSASDPTGFGVVLEADNGTALGSGKRSVTCQLSNCQYSAVGKATPIGDYVIQDVRGFGKIESFTSVDNLSNSAF